MTSPNPAQRLRVLIADDSQETRRAVRLLLFTIPNAEVVAIAQDGLQAVEMTRKMRPDIAFLDVNMPGLDGISAMRQMLVIYPEIVCIIISAERDEKTLTSAMAAGARGYLIKPFTAEEVTEAFERVEQMVATRRRTAEKTIRLVNERNRYLKQLAEEYARARRHDDQAIEVFEELAEDPDCELRWMMTLAMMYVLRREWLKLQQLAQRLEQIHPAQS